MAPGVVEVFAGVGSVAAGFVEVLGGDIILLNDVDPLAKQAAKDNLGEDVLYDDGDVRELTGERVVDAADGRDVTALLGCPPCQGWSAAGLRQSNDARNLLLGEFFRLVRELTPRFFVMENVAGVAGRSEFAGALASVNDRYSWWAGVLNSASYGLPQTRQRTLALGYRRDLGVNPTAPKPTHGGARGVWDYRSESLMTPSAETLDAILGSAPRVQPGRGSFHSMTALYDDIHDLPNFVTVEDAIGDLDGNDPSEYSLALRGAGPLPVPVPDDHVAWGHGPAPRSASEYSDGSL
ncbi:MAG TPA: DNA cytosine methyltransferase, partial [Egibacteraceae bacterium]|nr:DNA cytosine methyltransferase [Egibacteraceae bacterium]